MFQRGQKQVLVVDDDPGVRKLISHALEQEGMGVHCASDGNEALNLWEENSYSLIITDLVIPPLGGGVELLRTIRRQSSEIPILAITGFGQELAQEALDAGADRVLRKPFHLLELREVLKEMLS